jgi:hypothetical protein
MEVRCRTSGRAVAWAGSEGTEGSSVAAEDGCTVTRHDWVAERGLASVNAHICDRILGN